MNIVVLLILILLIFGGLPTWGYHDLGYFPSGGVGLLLLILIILYLLRII